MGRYSHKKAYSDTWKLAAEKEKRVVKLLKDMGLPCVSSGFGAGEAGYIKGSGQQNGYERAEPDLTVSGTPVRIEVTGPLSELSESEALFVNITKIEYAKAHPELQCWIAHVNGVAGKIRFVVNGPKLWQGIDAGRIKVRMLKSRGVKHTYAIIRQTEPFVFSQNKWERFMKIVQK